MPSLGTSSLLRSLYYDVDAFLAEEEWIPCVTQFDFSYLQHLDPDLDLNQQQTQQRNSASNEDGGNTSSTQMQMEHLPEQSRIKMPLWAAQPWSTAGYVRIQFPRHFGSKTRDKLVAAPAEVALPRCNERYFLAGKAVCDLVHSSFANFVTAYASSPQPRGGLNRQAAARRHKDYKSMEMLWNEARTLRVVLVSVCVSIAPCILSSFLLAT
jgi:hypothetical protein